MTTIALALRLIPWFAPQVVIPLVGIVLGNLMSGVSVSFSAFNTAIVRERAAIKGRLALGEQAATSPPMRCRRYCRRWARIAPFARRFPSIAPSPSSFPPPDWRTS